MSCRKYFTENEIPSHKSHYVYVVRCGDDTLYTGYTTELVRRIREHNEGTGAKYTRGRAPIQLVYAEEGENRSWGLKRERAIKNLSRQEKEALIAEAKGGTGADGGSAQLQRE